MLPFFAWKIFSISFFISLDFYLQVLFRFFAPVRSLSLKGAVANSKPQSSIFSILTAV